MPAECKHAITILQAIVNEDETFRFIVSFSPTWRNSTLNAVHSIAHSVSIDLSTQPIGGCNNLQPSQKHIKSSAPGFFIQLLPEISDVTPGKFSPLWIWPKKSKPQWKRLLLSDALFWWKIPFLYALWPMQPCWDLREIPIIPKPELRRVWGDSHTSDHHFFGDLGGLVAIICLKNWIGNATFLGTKYQPCFGWNSFDPRCRSRWWKKTQLTP